MKVYFNIPEIKEKTTVAIGTFDGLHLGHKTVLRRAQLIADQKGHSFVVFTFLDHPAIVTGSKKVPLLLTTSEEKISLLEHFQIDYCIIPNFDRELSLLTPEEFIEKVLMEKLKAQNICVGFNFFFGHKAAGNGETLKQLSTKYGYQAEIVEPVMYDGQTVNSSVIRKLLSDGEIEKAEHLLGYPYFLKGVVVKGKGIGRSVLGIPTANVAVSPRKLLPKNGVYSCEVKVRDEKHIGVVNLGTRPTFDNGTQSIEVHILNFSDDIYEESLELNFKTFLREERKFDGIEQLKQQILADIEQCKTIFSSKIK
jgi:riboflavin kinase/FMN adenylyltransferase